ncbi:response regulator transcription factor, partial [Pseudomonas protegens]
SEELLGKNVGAIGFIAEAAAASQLFSQLEKAGNVDGLDLKVRQKNAGLIDCVAYADTVLIQDSPCYLLVLMDITERKRSELELVGAIEEVMRDASWFSRTLIEKLANVRSPKARDTPGVSSADLTAREREVLGLIYQGLADKEIAAQLKLAPNTVRNHVATLYSKLGVHSRGEAIVWARERGLFVGTVGSRGR